MGGVLSKIVNFRANSTTVWLKRVNFAKCMEAHSGVFLDNLHGNKHSRVSLDNFHGNTIPLVFRQFARPTAFQLSLDNFHSNTILGSYWTNFTATLFQGLTGQFTWQHPSRVLSDSLHSNTVPESYWTIYMATPFQGLMGQFTWQHHSRVLLDNLHGNTVIGRLHCSCNNYCS